MSFFNADEENSTSQAVPSGTYQLPSRASSESAQSDDSAMDSRARKEEGSLSIRVTVTNNDTPGLVDKIAALNARLNPDG
jgi:hypothetical protein